MQDDGKNGIMSLMGSLLKNKIFWYLTSRYLVLGIQFIASVLLAVKLGAYYLGIWSSIVLFVGIGTQCNWGIGNAVSILLVQHKTESEKCRDYTYNAFVLVFILMLPMFLILGYDRIFGIVVFEKYQIGNYIYAIILLVFLQHLSSFFINIFRVKNRIWEILLQQSLWPLAMFVMVLTVSGRTLIHALVFAYLAALLIPVGIFFFSKQLDLKGRFSLRCVGEIFKKGVFIFLYNTGFALIVLSTKMMISKYYKIEEFGYFSFAFNLAQGVMYLIDCMIFLLFPKMTDMLKGDDRSEILKNIKILRDNYIFPLHLMVYCILAAAPLFFNSIPDFSGSFKAFALILLALLMYSHCFGYNSYLLAQNKEKESAYFALASLVMNIAVNYVMIKILNCSYEYVMLGTLLVYGLYSVVVNCYALYCIGKCDWKTYIKENVPAGLLLFYTAALLLTVYDPSNPYFYWGLLLCFCVCSIPTLKKLLHNCCKLIKNDKLINV